MSLKIKDKWIFWYSPRGKKAKSDATNYINNLTKLGEFQYIEDFFRFYCFLKRPSEIDVDNKLILFRSGKMPMWEECLEGGCWIIQFKKRQLQELNKRWEAILMACITEEFEEEGVLGVVLSKRSKRNLIELWVGNRDEDMKIKIGEKLRHIMEMDPQNLTFYFKEHSKSFQVPILK